MIGDRQCCIIWSSTFCLDRTHYRMIFDNVGYGYIYRIGTAAEYKITAVEMIHRRHHDRVRSRQRRRQRRGTHMEAATEWAGLPVRRGGRTAMGSHTHNCTTTASLVQIRWPCYRNRFGATTAFLKPNSKFSCCIFTRRSVLKRIYTYRITYFFQNLFFDLVIQPITQTTASTIVFFPDFVAFPFFKFPRIV